MSTATANVAVNGNTQIVQDLPQLLVNNMAANYIGKLMDQTNMNVFSMKNLIKIMMVLSIDEMRKGVKEIFVLGREHIPVFIKYLLGKALLITLLTKKIRFPSFQKQSLPVLHAPTLVTGSKYGFEWKNFQLYHKIIYDQLTNNPKCQAIKFYSNVIETVEYGKNLYTIDFLNIRIPIDTDKFLAIEKLSFRNDETFDISSTSAISDDCLSYYIEQNEFGKTLKNYMISIFKYWCQRSPNYSYGGNCVHDIMPETDPVELQSKMSPSDLNEYLKNRKYTVEQKFTAVIMSKYPKFDHRKVYLEIQIIMNSSYMTQFAKCSLGVQTGSSWTIILTKLIALINFGKLNIADLLSEFTLEPSESSISGNNKMELIKKNAFKISSQSVVNSLAASIESPNYYSDEVLLKSFVFYLEKNSTRQVKQDKDVIIYELKLATIKKVNQSENPEYSTWKELKDEVMAKVKDSIDISKVGLEKPPTKFIETITYDKEIVKTEVNVVHKSSDTLYLPKNLSTSLFRIMDNFMNKKDGLFKRLGIPNKLGICLYGKPGTGKSTAIKVIGSYLGKDIYYLNMNGITKNSELKMMFDCVIKHSCDGGIIVFEDIDCMTDIVKPRKIINDKEKLVDAMNTDELSLSYLLNLLDGTLCAKNTIFIITTNHIDHLDPALVRAGRCDIKIELKECDRYQIASIWKSIMENPLDERILDTVPEYQFTPADLIFHLIEYVYHPNIDASSIFDALYRKLRIDMT